LKDDVYISLEWAIEDEVEAGRLYYSKVRGLTFKRHFYIAYLKDRRHDLYLEKIVEYIMKKEKI